MENENNLRGYRFEYSKEGVKAIYISYGGGLNEDDARERFVEQYVRGARLSKEPEGVTILECKECSSSYKSMVEGLSRD